MENQGPGAASKVGAKLFLWAAVALCLKLGLALRTYGTNDVLFWEANLRKVEADGGLALYRDGAIPEYGGKIYRAEPFNQPPFLIHLMRLWGLLSSLGIPMRVSLKMTSAFADLAALFLVVRILARAKVPNHSSLILLALSPISILVSGFHGNTDPLMILFVLLSLSAIETERPVWIAGLALGMAFNIKVVAVIFLPVLVLHLKDARARMTFLSSAGAVFVAGSMPYLAQDPALILRSLFGYQPAVGLWGLTGLAYLTSEPALHLYRTIGRPAALAAVFVTSFWANRRSQVLFIKCGLVAFVFLFLISGFGPQYLAWLTPWWVMLPWKRVRWFYWCSGLFLFTCYVVWSRGSFYLANTMELFPPPPGKSFLFFLEICCWLSIGSMVYAYLSRITTVAKKGAQSS